MRLSTLLLVLLVLAAAALGVAIYRKATERTRNWHRILDLEGKDLRTSSGAAELFDLALRLPPPRPTEVRFTPWQVLRSGASVLLLLKDAPAPEPIPVTLMVHVFSEHGELRGSFPFSSGFGFALEDARTVAIPGIDGPLLELRGASDPAGPARQIYAVIDDDVALIRLEDSLGRSVVNRYDSRLQTIGPPFPARTPEAHAAALGSPNAADVLRILVWLGGQHSEAGGGKATEAHRETLLHPGVRARIGELKRSPNAWIREAAAAVK